MFSEDTLYELPDEDGHPAFYCICDSFPLNDRRYVVLAPLPDSHELDFIRPLIFRRMEDNGALSEISDGDELHAMSHEYMTRRRCEGSATSQ